MQWWFLPVFDFSLRLRHRAARQRPCGMCTYTAATLGNESPMPKVWGDIVDESVVGADRERERESEREAESEAQLESQRGGGRDREREGEAEKQRASQHGPIQGL